jgi:ceramide glucosyltransferase
MITHVLLVVTAMSWIYWLIACVAVRRFFRRPEPLPLFMPPVSVLKPVKGVDAGAFENFASFCRQDYPSFEILFGVADGADAVVPLLHRLRREFPHIPMRIVVAHGHGTNRKASTLHTLAREAVHDVLVVNDSDMRVDSGYLRQVVAPLGDPATGLVTCPYRGADPVTLTARLEALYMGVTFLPSVIVAWTMTGLKFGLGATMVLRRAELDRIGGFLAVADYLADDYEIGSRIGALGLKVHLSRYLVSSMLGATSFRDQWDREVRWSRCNRVSQPGGYAGFCLTFTTPLAVASLIASGLAPAGWAVLAGSILLRWTAGYLITAETKDAASRRFLFLLPLRDMLSFVIWAAGMIGRRVVWRGEAFFVLNDGRLQEQEQEREPAVLEGGGAGRLAGGRTSAQAWRKSLRRAVVPAKTEVPR